MGRQKLSRRVDVARAAIKLAIPVKQHRKRGQVRKGGLADRNDAHDLLKERRAAPIALSP